MELLTNRLLMMAEQVSENHMVDLIDNERIELERLRNYRPYRKGMESNYRTIGAQSQIRKSKIGNTVLTKHRVNTAFHRNNKEENTENTNEDEQKNEEEGPKVKSVTTVCDIWGFSKKIKNDGSKLNESHESPTENPAPKINLGRFRKVARTTVLLESLKGGHAICTCENLDAHCKVHDS